MAIYEWKGRSSLGEALDGRLEAASEYAAADQLILRGVAPTRISIMVEPVVDEFAELLARLNRKPIVPDDILIFTRQMYTMDKAGVPILRALAGLQASATKPSVASMLADTRASLEKGSQLSSALEVHAKHFGAFYISMVRIGEMTGRLTEVLLQLSKHIEFEQEVKTRIKEALRYPMFVMSAMGIALVILNVFVIPVFAKTFASFHAELPMITRGLLGFSAWTVQWWPVLLVLALGSVWGVKRYLRTPLGRFKWDAKKLKLPIVGDIILKATLARFARSFALSIQSGVPMGTALSGVAQTVENAFIGSRIETMREGIERGESITRCADATGVFTPIVMQMIAVGEETGELDALLFEISEMYERDTAYSIKGLSSAIEPILLGVVGVLVLLLALGVFMPLWNIGQAAMGRGGG